MSSDKVIALANSSLPLHPQEPRKLTSEAILMIFIILLFLLFAALGTAITIFEYFDKPRKMRHSFGRICRNGKYTNNDAPSYKEMESLRNSPQKVDLEEIKSWISHWSAPIFLKVSYSVNVFFVISGFLNGYFFSLEYSEKSGRISWLNYYRKRFLRIAPLHMMVYWTYTTLFTYTGSGPLWPTYESNPVCIKYWWWDLFYVSNFLAGWQQVPD
ncbi:nose resistant to fluoxetine protein 6 [Trichonephila clavata]|uniref:Nose resistant to fluoxetine protein 6 n=1 Tax=Trichonephila clavata TaxID=2740835 RepID=A0A8X6IQ66_TRICU|nr:nose resistant to fluoxetine protein 6 [Trichonephila clavata]